VKIRIVLIFVAICVATQAQVTQRRPTVRAIGDATITATPDQATVIFVVESRAVTAQDAAAQNATATSTVLAALRAITNGIGDIHTTNYSLNPVYTYPANGGGQGTLTGFMVSNSIQVTITNLAIVGKVLDTGTQAGATRVQSLTFGLKDAEPMRLQALRQAAALARTHADAMTGGAGLHTGSVIAMDEGGTTPRVVNGLADAAAAPTTPILPGTVTVTATVTMDFEIVP
jgi:uncharacterized protein YggE